MKLNTFDEYVNCIVDILKMIKKNKGRIRNALKRCLSELLDPTYFDGKHNISEKAFEEAKKLGINEKIIYMTWQQLGKYKSENNKSGNGKRAFILEHYCLRSYIKNELYEIKNPNRNDVIKIINDSLKTCIITHDENKNLNDKGYGQKRLDPKKAYKDAGIRPKCSW